eukprot:scaffold6358_cov80-Cylindrotheca_fusiformis.AAC.4
MRAALGVSQMAPQPTGMTTAQSQHLEAGVSSWVGTMYRCACQSQCLLGFLTFSVASNLSTPE